MNCPRCHSDLPSGANFCPQCGTALSSAAPSTQPGSPSAGVNLRRGNPREVDVEHDIWQGRGSLRILWVTLAVLGTLTAVATVAAFALHGWVLASFVFGVGVLIEAVFTISSLWRHFSLFFRLSTQRLIVERGIVSRIVDRVEVIDIQDVRFQQGFIGRVLGVGDIVVSSGDRSTPELTLRNIEEVQQVADAIDAARRSERNRRGLFIDTVNS